MIQRAGKLLQLFAKGLLTLAALIAALASLIYSAKQAATSAADAEMTAWARDHGTPDAMPLGLVVPDSELPRLTKALTTITEQAIAEPETVTDGVSDPEPVQVPEEALAEQITPKIERLVSAEVKTSEWDSTRDAMAARGVTRWRWVAQSTACKFCRARNGKTYKIELKFRDHPNCSCTMEPVEKEIA